MTMCGVDHRVDWWSFGILIYELLYGFTPFRGKKRDETFNNILKRPLNFPEQPEVSEACKVCRGIWHKTKNHSSCQIRPSDESTVRSAWTLMRPGTWPRIFAAGSNEARQLLAEHI